ncbi:hypothetical protein OH491_14385 [Termitidicoccus mucosus]|uniref:hypothetical protein n=1 Tax=Termitidicoccus mucosus TaxID=1184151 RepID=UPI0011AB611B
MASISAEAALNAASAARNVSLIPVLLLNMDLAFFQAAVVSVLGYSIFWFGMILFFEVRIIRGTGTRPMDGMKKCRDR